MGALEREKTAAIRRRAKVSCSKAKGAEGFLGVVFVAASVADLGFWVDVLAGVADDEVW